MIEHLNSINTTKKNIIRDSDDKFSAERAYPRFPVTRSLSYHPDAILLVNELNIRGLESHNVSNLMHYEFLLYVLPQKKRFAKWAKSSKDNKLELLIQFYGYSKSKAMEVLDLIPQEEYDRLQKLRDQMN